MISPRFQGLLAFALLSAGGAASAQEMTLDQVLAGKSVPLAIQAKSLTGEFRRLVAGDAPSIASVQNMMITAKTGVESGLYFSKGQTVSAGGETYLIAYRPQFQVDIAGVFGHGHGHGNDNGPKPMRKLRPNMKLALSLLNLRSNARFDDIRPFDSARDLETPQESSDASTRNLRALGQGMMTYLNNRGRGAMPLLGERLTPAVKRTFYPFVHDQNLWVQPATEEDYRPNARVSNVNVNRVANRPYLPAFYENTPGSDGLRGVVFLDGHVERVNAARFGRLQNARVIARPGVKSVYATGARTVVVGPDEDSE